MQPGQALGDVFARVLSGLAPILTEFQPDYVLVQGDTASSTAAAIAAFYSGVAVGHVEAGLRTGNLKSPWPEEANRRLTAVVASRHYAPTPRARDALLEEGHPGGSIILTGNTVIDALLHVANAVTSPGPLKQRLGSDLFVARSGKSASCWSPVIGAKASVPASLASASLRQDRTPR